MRTNYSGFALAVSMGLIVVLIGFLALSIGGLVQIGPTEEVTSAAPADSTVTPGTMPVSLPATAYKATLPADAAAIQAGDALFKGNCAQCHAINEKVVGPALAGITKRRRLPWITAWVHNSAKVIASGDEYAVKLFEDNGKQQMPAFPQLSGEDIAAIIAYVSAQEASAPAAGAATVVAAK